MLVLTRKPNQQLHIGNDIVITIVKVRGNTIRLGIEAPKDVRVIRSELEPKPVFESKSPAGKAAASESQPSPSASASASQAGDQPETDAAASADDAQEAAPAHTVAAPRLIFEARIQRPAQADSPLKRFTAVKRLPTALAERNLEDCPLCHRASQESEPAPRPTGLHNYIALKNRGGSFGQNALRDKPLKSKDALSKSALNQ